MKKTIFIILVLCGLLATGCANTATHTDNTIKIGGLFGLTGMSQAFGQDERQAAQLAIEEINAASGISGKQLSLIVEDGQTTIQGNLNGYQKLVTVDHVKYIIGPTWTEAAHALVPHIIEDGVILISPSAGEVEHELFNNENFFKIYPPYRDETPVMIEHMKDAGIKRIAIVQTDGSFEESMRVGFVENARGHDITVVSTQKTPYGEADFHTILTKIQETKPDAIYLLHGSFEGVGEFFEQARALDMQMPIYTYSGCEQQDLLENYGHAIEGMLFPASALGDRDKAFNAKFKARYGSEPLTAAAATAYDAVKMLAIGLENGEDVESVREGMNAISDYQGASPITGFDQNGWPITDRQYIMKTVEDGEFVALES